jgi:hypothetical protein
MIVTPSYSIPKGVNSGVFGIVTGKYCKEVEDVIAVAKSKGYLIPSDFSLRIVSDCINELKSAGIWQYKDLLYWFSYNQLAMQNTTPIANQPFYPKSFVSEFTYLNYINPKLYECTRLGNAIYPQPVITNKGWKNFAPIGNIGILDTNWVAKDNAIKYSRNSASFCFFIPEELNDITGSATSYITGFRDGTNVRASEINPYNGTANVAGFINDLNPGNINIGASNSNPKKNGYYCVERSASNLVTAYKDGVSIGTSTRASQTLLSAISLGVAGTKREAGNTTTFDSPTGYFSCGSHLGATLQKTEYEIIRNAFNRLGIL